MKFHEVAQHALQHGCLTFFPTKEPGEYAIKDSGYTADAVEGREAARPWVKPARIGKGIILDTFSASAFVAVRNALNEVNRTKYDGLAAKNPVRAVEIAFQLAKGKS